MNQLYFLASIKISNTISDNPFVNLILKLRPNGKFDLYGDKEQSPLREVYWEYIRRNFDEGKII